MGKKAADKKSNGQEYEDAKALTEMWRLLKVPVEIFLFCSKIWTNQKGPKTVKNSMFFLQDEALTKDRRMVRVWCWAFLGCFEHRRFDMSSEVKEHFSQVTQEQERILPQNITISWVSTFAFSSPSGFHSFSSCFLQVKDFSTECKELLQVGKGPRGSLNRRCIGLWRYSRRKGLAPMSRWKREWTIDRIQKFFQFSCCCCCCCCCYCRCCRCGCDCGCGCGCGCGGVVAVKYN